MKRNSNPFVVYWLASGALLILIMVVVGGITRLTHSGLSMVQWKLFMGSIPPLNQSDWEATFDLYKLTPEFQIKNYNFTLDEFKSIFWWEYIHRMIGRFIGLVFIFPFLYFLYKKQFEKPFLRKLWVVFALGAFQGFMGWYMVKSGLVNDPNVSHYRLASHLMTAFALYAFIFWLMLDRIYGSNQSNVITSKIQKSVKWLIGIVLIQIVYGAFVSGLKAGFMYNTFPKMGDDWIAESVGFMLHKTGIISLLENPASVQFVHRYIAYIVIAVVILIWKQSNKITMIKLQKRGLYFIVLAVFVQVLLGILTLLMIVPVTLGVLHQLGALILLTTLVNFLFQLKHSQNKLIDNNR